MASDSIQTQKDIFSGVQGLLAFLDTTDEKKNRENTEAWKNTLESLRNISSNPLPFLLELLKILKQKKSNEKAGQKAKKMRAAKRKKRRGQKNKTEDGKFKETGDGSATTNKTTDSEDYYYSLGLEGKFNNFYAGAHFEKYELEDDVIYFKEVENLTFSLGYKNTF